MRIARILGTVTLNRSDPHLRSGRLLLAEAFDAAALAAWPRPVQRAAPMPESLVLFDELGAGVGQIVACSEGREASMPFWPKRVPIDAYCAAILDWIQWTPHQPADPAE